MTTIPENKPENKEPAEGSRETTGAAGEPKPREFPPSNPRDAESGRMIPGATPTADNDATDK